MHSILNKFIFYDVCGIIMSMVDVSNLPLIIAPSKKDGSWLGNELPVTMRVK